MSRCTWVSNKSSIGNWHCTLLLELHCLQQWGRNDPVRLFALTCGRLPRTWDCYSIRPASTEAVSPSTLVNTG